MCRRNASSYLPLRTRETYPCAFTPAGQVKLQGEEPARSMTAFFGTAWGKAMWAARVATRSALNLSEIATVHASSQSPHPVHAAGSTKVGFLRSRTANVPSSFRTIPSTSL